MTTKTLFNPTTQQAEEASFSVDQNGDYVATFANGHFIKFNGTLSPEALQTALQDLKSINEGQVDAQAVQAETDAKLAVIDGIVVTGEASAPPVIDAQIVENPTQSQ